MPGPRPWATPPAWLTEKYPEVLNAFKDGTLIRHGLRRHYNYNSKVYRERTAIIVEKIAEHYSSRKCIIGWQIDNEFNCESTEFYSEADHAAFRAFLQGLWDIHRSVLSSPFYFRFSFTAVFPFRSLALRFALSSPPW